MLSDMMPTRLRLSRYSYIEDAVCVWINSNVHDKFISLFEKRYPSSKIFHHIDEFMKYVNDDKNNRIFLILSQSIDEPIIENIDDLSQINSIYLFSLINTNDVGPIKQSKKFQGTFIDLEKMFDRLNEDIIRCQNNIVEFDCLSPNFQLNTTNKSTNMQEANSMYAQLLKEILTKVEYSQSDTKEMITYLRLKYSNNTTTLKLIDEFQSKYEPQDSISWYTKDSILYNLINKGLRMQNIDVLYPMRVFIKNLHQKIVQLHQNSRKTTEELKLYRGQIMLTKDFQQIKNNIAGLLSFTSFLSTSKNKSIALNYTQSSTDTETAVLFEITIDLTSYASASYADIMLYSDFGRGEEEYLFSMGSVFRIKTVDLDDNGIYHVHLSLTSDNDKLLTDLTKYMREEYITNPPSICDIAVVLFKKGDYTKAKQICEKILINEKHPAVQANIYNKLGLYTRRLGDLSQSLSFYEKSLQKFDECGIKDGVAVGTVFLNIARVYKEKKDYTLALDYNERALNIHEKESNLKQDAIALIENNIAVFYCEQENFSKASEHFVKSLKLRLKYLPPLHPDTAQSFNNIGYMYYQLNQNENALFFHILSLKMKERSMCPEDSSFARTLNTMAAIYKCQNKIEKARECLVQAVKIAETSLGQDHQDTQFYKTHLNSLAHSPR